MFYGLSAQELQHIVRKPKPKGHKAKGNSPGARKPRRQESQESQKHEVSAIATAKKPEWRKNKKHKLSIGKNHPSTITA